MNISDFFGFGTNSSAYDGRRHIMTIFYELMSYKMAVDGRGTVNKVSYTLNLPEQQAAEYICNAVLSYDEHNFLNLLRERYNVSSTDFTTILAGRCLTLRQLKTPAGYDREQNLRLLVQMVIARYYMRPQVNNAFTQINTMIISIAQGMRGISVSQTFANNLFHLTVDAMGIYGDNYHIREIEDYVIRNI